MPAPTLCPECRERRRLAWRNERNLYRRTCDLTGRDVISVYSPDKPFTVYEQGEWWGDRWDAFDYGRDMDFGRGFFDNFAALLREVPRPSILNRESENAEYTSVCFHNKNAYLLFECSYSEDCYHSYFLHYSNNCIDCTLVKDSEHCYEMLDSASCHNVQFANNCYSCKASVLLSNCRNCEFCMGCVGLQDKQYHILNAPVEADVYEQACQRFSESLDYRQAFIQQYNTLSKTSIRKYMEGEGNENVLGNYIDHCHDCHYCYDSYEMQDCNF